MSAAASREQRLATAKALVAHLEAGREQEAGALARELADAEGLAEDLGRMTRELHEALNALRVDPRISELASNDIPDAREKLSWVLTLTEQAAHTVISAVEEGLPVSTRVAEDDSASDAVRAAGQRMHEIFSDILMAQSFQDLSGQAIRRVIEVSGELERRLASLVQRAGGKPPAAPVAGPGAQRVQGQDEVDALLSGLGF
ncbi:protein phosphatase CheZ [Wenzhouxiangella sp. XN24]|uniref:protein phosphatase CheZ n=1 Tax=Wenzhouxiangella sp. XN24 TaxID=2713569 RepID=UPI0013EA5F5F|nr:protein phosphatase CheZ [Wenzhouxiangella sp. XN24]